MQFDPCYEPIVVGQLLVIGSPNDGSVTAYDTESGEQRWRYWTNGPVRFAPAAWRDSVLVAADDGYVYALEVKTGVERWRVRIAPADRPDYLHLGNGRLVSFWPVRGGPIVADDTLFVGAGIWPVLGTFVTALDPATGAVRWHNARLSHMTNIRTDHNRIADSALCPQGYLVAAGQRLLVPNGRGMPVGLDRATGQLLYYVQGYRNGHCRVTTAGKWVFVGSNAVLDVATGREMGGRWHEGMPETPAEYSQRIDLFETPMLGYKFVPACDAWSVLGPNGACGMREGTLYAYDLNRAGKSTYKRKRGALELEPAKWEAPLRWKLQTPYAAAKPRSTAVIQAGPRLYAHADNVLLAVDAPGQDGKPGIAWETKLPGTPATMLAGDDRLFVVTAEGQLLCFGADAREPRTHALPNEPIPAPSDEWSGGASRLLAATGVTDGYALVLGVGNGRLVEELLRQSQLAVIAVTAGKARADALRERLGQTPAGRERVQVLNADPFGAELPPYLASLVVSETAALPEIARDLSPSRLTAMLRPYGGAACLGHAGPADETVTRWLSAVEQQGLAVQRSDALVCLRRAGALPGSADWTHESASPARTYFSTDALVKAPLGVLWYGDGPDQGFKKHKDYHVGVKPQVVAGRLFAFDEREKVLQAYDVYTGRVLWRHEVAAFTRFASMPDGIYTGQGSACIVYDPATGRELSRFSYRVGEDHPQLFVADLRVAEDVIVIAVDSHKSRSIADGLYDSTALLGLDRTSGKQLWTRRAEKRFNHHGVALGGGLLYAADSASAETTSELQRRGETPATLDSVVLALDPRTGAERWRQRFSHPFLSYAHTDYAAGAVQSMDDALFYSAACDVLIACKDRRYHAVKGKTGDLLWEQEKGAGQPIMVAGERFYNGGGGAFDVRTGVHIPGDSRIAGGNGCNHAVGSTNLFFRRRFTAAYFDVATGKATYMLSARSGCTNSLIPACGVVSSPCFSVGCVCNHPVETSFCLVHMPGIEAWSSAEPVREPMPLGERDPARWRALMEAAKPSEGELPDPQP